MTIGDSVDEHARDEPARAETVTCIASMALNLAALASGLEAPLLTHLLSMAAVEARDMERGRSVAAIDHPAAQ